MKIGTTDIKDVFLGTAEVKKIFRGTTLLYEKVLPPSEPALFYGGQTTQTVVKSDFELSVIGSNSYGGTIQSIAIDDNYVYVGGQITRKVRKYNKGDLSYIGESPDYGGYIYSIAIG